MQTEKLILHPWQEVFGIVDGVETHEERGVLRITLIRRIGLEIPLNELMEGGVNLVQLKGRKISILRTNNDYLLQCKPDNNTGSKASLG